MSTNDIWHFDLWLGELQKRYREQTGAAKGDYPFTTEQAQALYDAGTDVDEAVESFIK
jgi:hypothetical protein